MADEANEDLEDLFRRIPGQLDEQIDNATQGLEKLKKEFAKMKQSNHPNREAELDRIVREYADLDDHRATLRIRRSNPPVLPPPIRRIG